MGRLLKVLALELVDGNIRFLMHMDLIKAYEASIGHGGVMRESWTFWSLTINSHIDSAIFRLCRIYDQHKTNLGMRGLLHNAISTCSRRRIFLHVCWGDHIRTSSP
jgi:hypothetical protein